MKKINSCSSQGGFSLIELMIAMLLGLVLMVGVISVFMASSQTYRLQEAMFRVQESGRFALDIMLKDLRDAGFQNLLPPDSSRNTGIPAIQGFAIGTVPASLPVLEGLQGRVIAGVSSDILSIWNNASASGGGAAYYVAPDAGGQRALFRNTDAVVEGVENVAFTYGVDTDSDRQPDAYFAAGGVTQWGDVIAVRVNFLVASSNAGVVEQAQAAPAPFDAAPYTVTTTDRRLYQVYTTTVALRNKMP